MVAIETDSSQILAPPVTGAITLAKATAALAGRSEVGEADVFEAASLALGHRIAFDPFEPSEGLDERQLRRVLEDVLDAEKKALPTTAPAASTPTSPSWREPSTSS